MRYIISLLLTSAALPALAEVPHVVTDIPPVHALTAQVMGDLGQPDLLLDKGGNAHSFQMRPSQAAGLADADLVIWVGPKMTPWLDRALGSLGEGAARLTLLEAPGTHLQDFPEAGAHAPPEAHDHDDHGHDDHAHEEDAHAGHGHEGLDPHAWLDPANGRHWLGVIAAELGRLDPDNAAIYAANAEAAQARVGALDGELAAMLVPAQGRPFIVAHDAYDYFAGHYGLTVAGSIKLGDATDAGAAHLVELREQLAGAVCVFPEAAHDAKPAKMLIEGTEVRLGGVLDPEGSTVTPGPDAYEAVLRNMAQTLVECLAP